MSRLDDPSVSAESASAESVSDEPHSVSRAARATGLLRAFNDAGLLSAADVHVATRVAELVGERSDAVRLAAALAVRGPRRGHVCVDLETIRATASVESEEPLDLAGLPWPAPQEWIAGLTASGLVAVGEERTGADRPLRLIGPRLYLDRYWRDERAVASDLLELVAGEPPEADVPVLAAGVARLFDAGADVRQRLAAAAAVLCRFAVVAGGPGTGKTTTVARIVALLAEQAQAQNQPMPLVALAAPTGKAAARLQESVHEQAAGLAVDMPIRMLLSGLSASTLHRLLGWRRGTYSRFAHDRGNRLPHDVVIVDETSMVSLSLMARLVEAVRRDARLILVGDPGQLTSIEAGVVLGDIVGPAATGLRMSAGSRERLTRATHAEVPGEVTAPSIGDGIVVLERVHRFGGGIAGVAEAIRRGDPEGTIEALGAAPAEITWLAAVPDGGAGGLDAVEVAGLDAVKAEAVIAGRAVVAAARSGQAGDALAALGRFRLLCAHRRGAHGVSSWTSRLQVWLSEAIEDLDLGQRDYAGRPLLVTENDYELALYNGDTGVIVQSSAEHLSAVFERGGRLLRVSPLRLGSVETVYAMTIHKSQGSQYDTAAVMLPPPAARILTRELLYTAVTRARRRLILVGTEETVRAAVARPVARASGLRERLWGPSTLPVGS